MFIVHYKKIFLGIGAALVGGAVAAILALGMPLGIDFAGGTLLEVRYEEERPAAPQVQEALEAIAIGSVSVRTSGEDGFIIRTRALAEAERQVVVEQLAIDTAEPVLERVTTIGPSLGSELARKALVALAVLSLIVLLYIAYVFRKVSRPVPSYVYGAIVVVVLLHDILLPAGFFALMGVLFGAEIDALFVVALLAILGYSVNDTIVVFDRIRENLRDNQEKELEEVFPLTVGKSLQQTYVRSINTSLTTALALLALFFFGAPVTENFALTLLIGVVAGTFSSLFIAAPLLVAVQERWFRRSNLAPKEDEEDTTPRA